MTRNKIAIFFYETKDINTFPSVTNTIRVLTGNEYEVDVYLSASMKTSMELPHARFIVVSKQKPYLYINETLRYIKKNKITYDVIFAFSMEGLIISVFLNNRHNKIIPVCYFSMELIYHKFILNTVKKWIIKKFRPRYAIEQIYAWYILQRKGREFITFSVAQDAERARELRSEFTFANKIYLVPNSYIGYTYRTSHYAYEMFNVPENKRILLFTGGVERGFDVGLLEMLRHLNSDYVLFLNVYSRDNYLHELLKRYAMLIQQGKLFINRENLSEEKYDMLVASAYIGLAWYPKPDPRDVNMFFLGLSSGKLNKYLSCGKPIIAPSYVPSYRELIDDNQIGSTCLSASNLPETIKFVENKYDAFQKHVKDYFIKNLEFGNKFTPVLEALRNTLH